MRLFLGTTREDWAEHNITRRGQKKQMGTQKLFLGTSLLVTFWAMPKSKNNKPIIPMGLSSFLQSKKTAKPQ